MWFKKPKVALHHWVNIEDNKRMHLEILGKHAKRAIYNRKFRWVLLLAVPVIGLVSHFLGPLYQGSVTGSAKVVDGDSLIVGSHRVRLHGIDAPELRQTCYLDGRRWACGEAARDQLKSLINGQQLTCKVINKDQYDRLLAECQAGSRNINQQMVAMGAAVAFGNRHRSVEALARSRRLGLWAGEFVRPQVWRRDNPRQ